MDGVPAARAIIDVVFAGHLDSLQLNAALSAAEKAIREAPAGVGLLVDCRNMSGYDAVARELFVSWNARMRPRIARLAVVTERQLWHVVVGAMALASRQTMKAFSETAEARRWLET